MPCKTCDHTVQYVGKTDDKRRIFWCPRCGTLEYPADLSSGPESVAPALVGHCRAFREHWPSLGAADADWSGHGIAESINTQENRP